MKKIVIGLGAALAAFAISRIPRRVYYYSDMQDPERPNHINEKDAPPVHLIRGIISKRDFHRLKRDGLVGEVKFNDAVVPFVGYKINFFNVKNDERCHGMVQSWEYRNFVAGKKLEKFTFLFETEATVPIPDKKQARALAFSSAD